MLCFLKGGEIQLPSVQINESRHRIYLGITLLVEDGNHIYSSFILFLIYLYWTVLLPMICQCKLGGGGGVMYEFECYDFQPQIWAFLYCGDRSRENVKLVGAHFLREIYIYQSIWHTGAVEICFASIMQASAKPFVAFFSCFFLIFVFTPTEFTVTELCDDNLGTWLVTFSLAWISCF